MTALRALISGGVIVLLSAACGQNDWPHGANSSNAKYELKQDKNGRTVRLNRETGETAILEGSTLVAVETPEQVSRRTAETRRIAEAKAWPTVALTPIENSAEAYLKTSWREGQLYYQFWIRATPRVKALRTQAPFGRYFKAQLLDHDGFSVATVQVALNDFTGTMNESGDVQWLVANSSMPCSIDTYRAAENWTVEWNL